MKKLQLCWYLHHIYFRLTLLTCTYLHFYQLLLTSYLYALPHPSKSVLFLLFYSVLFLFLAYINPIILLNAMLQSLILCSAFFVSLASFITITESHNFNMNKSFGIIVIKIKIIKDNIIKNYIMKTHIITKKCDSALKK